MSRPIESDYTSQVAYTRALEAYCDSLAQQEPVLVVRVEPDYMSGGHHHKGSKPYIDLKKLWKIPIGTELYTSPPAQRKPLTDEQVTDGCRSLGVGAYRTLAAAFEAGVRFAEAAHGIKENT